MPGLKSLLDKLNANPNIKSYKGEVVKSETPPPMASTPKPNASPTFSKNFTSMLGAVNQPEIYNQTTLQAPSPTNNSSYLEGDDKLREHLRKFATNQESNRQKYKGY